MHHMLVTEYVSQFDDVNLVVSYVLAAPANTRGLARSNTRHTLPLWLPVLARRVLGPQELRLGEFYAANSSDELMEHSLKVDQWQRAHRAFLRAEEAATIPCVCTGLPLCTKCGEGCALHKTAHTACPAQMRAISLILHARLSFYRDHIPLFRGAACYADGLPCSRVEEQTPFSHSSVQPRVARHATLLN